MGTTVKSVLPLLAERKILSINGPDIEVIKQFVKQAKPIEITVPYIHGLQSEIFRIEPTECTVWLIDDTHYSLKGKSFTGVYDKRSQQGILEYIS